MRNSYGRLGQTILVQFFLGKITSVWPPSTGIGSLSASDLIFHVLIPETAVVIIMKDRGWHQFLPHSLFLPFQADARHILANSGEYGRARFRDDHDDAEEILAQLHMHQAPKVIKGNNTPDPDRERVIPVLGSSFVMTGGEAPLTSNAEVSIDTTSIPLPSVRVSGEPQVPKAQKAILDYPHRWDPPLPEIQRYAPGSSKDFFSPSSKEVVTPNPVLFKDTHTTEKLPDLNSATPLHTPAIGFSESPGCVDSDSAAGDENGKSGHVGQQNYYELSAQTIERTLRRKGIPLQLRIVPWKWSPLFNIIITNLVSMFPPHVFLSGTAPRPISDQVFNDIVRVVRSEPKGPGCLRTHHPGADLSLDSLIRLRDPSAWYNTEFNDAVCTAVMGRLARLHQEPPQRTVYVPMLLRWETRTYSPVLSVTSPEDTPWPGLGRDCSWRNRTTISVISTSFDKHFATLAIFGPQRLVVTFDGAGGKYDHKSLRNVGTRG